MYTSEGVYVIPRAKPEELHNTRGCMHMPYSLAVESKKRAERRRNWYSNDIGIKICEMFHTITYTKST